MAGFQDIARWATSSALPAFCSTSRTVVPVLFSSPMMSNTCSTRIGDRAHRGLVKHHQFRPAHEGAAHRQHLLLAAGQRSGGLLPPLLKPREPLIDRLKIVLRDGAFCERAHLQIFHDGHLQENPPPFRHMRQTRPDDFVRLCFCDIASVKNDRTCFRAQKARYRLQNSGLAGAVGADERHDLAGLHLERDALDGVDGP